MDQSSPRTKVAILGGGCGAISAAFWLTMPELAGRFEVTVYTQGWRLGGKGASGRNARVHNRIQEHGLHILMGFYQHAFTTIRKCYAEWRPQADNPFQTWDQAFTPSRSITLMQRVPDTAEGPWEPWRIDFPQLPGSPGDPPPSFDLGMAGRMLIWLRELLSDKLSVDLLHLRNALAAAEQILGDAARGIASIAEAPGASGGIIEGHLVLFQKWFREVGSLLLSTPDTYKVCTLADLMIAMALGYVRDVLPYGEPGFDRINDRDFKDWLLSHGANREYIWSAPVRALYDLGFAFEGGDASSPDKAKGAAGAALKLLMLMVFGYCDAPLWKMNAGMGDTIFTPLYDVLEKRGVKFEFFHRVVDLAPSVDGRNVETITLRRQVMVNGKYQPFVSVKGLRCWPSEPLWNQIEGGQNPAAWNLESIDCPYGVEERTIQRGGQFDVIVLATPPAAFRYFGTRLIANTKQLADMCQGMSWVATQSTQLWLTCKPQDLNGQTPPPVTSTYVEPIATWADMSHLLKREDSPSDVQACEYFCGVLVPDSPDPSSSGPDYLSRETRKVETEFDLWAKSYLGVLWPNVWPGAKGGAPSLRRDLISYRFNRANVDPSESYVQTFPGSVKYRLAPDDSGLDNLYLAGDWTKSRINGGSAEAAFESGRLAAAAIAARFR